MNESTSKRCSKCGAVKPLDEFHRSTRDGLQSKCKTCRRALGADYYAANSGKERARKVAYFAAHPEKRRARDAVYLAANPHYPRWASMIRRCENPKNEAYENYGGRGITVCDEWHDYATFVAWIDANLGPCPEGYSLDRIDNDSGYRPGNVKWSSAAEQRRNQRKRWDAP